MIKRQGVLNELPRNIKYNIINYNNAQWKIVKIDQSATQLICGAERREVCRKVNLGHLGDNDVKEITERVFLSWLFQ